jgi:pimeloyl-ACP methyl ester carboxylesterase
MAEGGACPPQGPPLNGDLSTSEVQFIETVEGRKLAYHKLEGSSPGVVFIHGLNSHMNGQKALALEQVCKRQGSSYVRFDLSGHGKSSMDFNLCNITVWLEDLNLILSSLTTGPQVLVGSSIGGWLMFLYTMRNPDNIFGLIGVGVAPDLTQRLWKGLSPEGKKEVKRTGVYRQETPYSDESYELTLQLIQDGDKYSIMDMPGKGGGGGG